MDKYLQQIASKLEWIERERAFREETIVDLLRLVRLHLEANDLKKRYRYAAFYCDWCFHVRLDRPSTVDPLLQRIDEAMADDGEGYLNDRINEAISLEGLRRELVELVSPVAANPSLFRTRAGWKAFTRGLLPSLIDKPLVRTRHPAGKRYVSQLLLEVPDVSGLDPAYVGEVEPGQGAVFWKALIGPIGYWLTGPLVLTSSPESFDR